MDYVEAYKQLALSANAFCPTGKGGGKDPTCSPGGKSAGKHSVSLPSNKKKLTIPKAGEALGEMGYKLGAGHTDIKKGSTVYELTNPDGSKTVASAEQIKEIVYRGAK